MTSQGLAELKPVAELYIANLCMHALPAAGQVPPGRHCLRGEPR